MKLIKAAGFVFMFIDGAICAVMGRQFIEKETRLRPLHSFRPAYSVVSKLPDPLFRAASGLQAVMAVLFLLKLRKEAD